MARTIILIGGTPTVGKSTLAQKISKHLNIPWISTDQIRTVMRATAKKEDYPDLFNSEGFSAEKFLTKFSADEIASMEYRQGEATWVGVEKLIKDDFTWRDGFIVEGVNILPHLVDQDFANKPNIKPIFLIDANENRMRNVVYSRGLWGDAKSYSDDVKEKEVEWAKLFSDRLKSEAIKYDYPWIEVNKNDKDLNLALEALRLT